MYPCENECSETPGLCTYYAVTSLMVIILAISLIWFPFVQLISEINLIVVKVVLYLNNEFFGIKDSYLINNLETVIVSRDILIIISLCCLTYVLYLGSSDFLISTACYVSLLPDNKYMICIKKLILRIIYKLLEWKGQNMDQIRDQKKRQIHFGG